ncbi:hypothetical protein ACQ9LF_06175 [Anaerohalosphaeraceae bacterium U12dextr]
MKEKFEQWAIVELFGHQRIAGKVTNQELGGETFIRVDVPETSASASYTKMYGKGAIYAITLVDELTAKAAAECMQPVPFNTYSIVDLIKNNPAMLESANEDVEDAAAIPDDSDIGF